LGFLPKLSYKGLWMRSVVSSLAAPSCRQFLG